MKWTENLPSSLVINVATLGPLGKLKAPGTVGSFVGLFWYTFVFYPASPLVFAFLLAASIFLGIAFCGEAEIRLGRVDPGEIILDEFVAVPICFLFDSFLLAKYPMWMVMLAGFFVFRFYDIFKPFGINRLQDYGHGVGVVLDDLAAAVATAITLHAGSFVLGTFGF